MIFFNFSLHSIAFLKFCAYNTFFHLLCTANDLLLYIVLILEIIVTDVNDYASVYVIKQTRKAAERNETEQEWENCIQKF